MDLNEHVETPAGAQAKANLAESNAKNASLPLAGGTMTGALNMGFKDITNVRAAFTSSASAYTMQVDNLSGNSVRLTAPPIGTDYVYQALQFDGVRNDEPIQLKHIYTPTDADDAANKQYVDAIKSTQVSATLTTTWTGASAPYTQAVTIAGMTATKNGIVGLAPTATAAERAAAKAASLMLTSQGTGTVTITADGDKPTIAIPIVITMMG